MGWKQYARSVEAAGRRAERAAQKRDRELEKEYQAQQRQDEREQAADEVARFEKYLDALVSVHKRGGRFWDWKKISVAPAPVEPVRATAQETAARHALEAFKPTFFQRLFGGERKLRAALSASVDHGAAEDLKEHERVIAHYREAAALWKIRFDLAAGVLRRDLDSYRAAVRHTGVADELSAFKTRIALDVVETEVVALSCFFEDDDLVPSEEVKLTAGAKLSTKEMAAGKYWALYQDHVCSCALRLAREILGVLPVARVVVNVCATRLDKSTGHPGVVTLLGVQFVRALVDRLNLAAIDPSDSMKNFPHRMKFKKTTGFEPVEPVTVDEQWVTT